MNFLLETDYRCNLSGGWVSITMRGMVKIDVTYEGDLHCRVKHGPSGMEITTDAPVDNQGKGEAFSPTDLAAAAMGSCMLTIMGIFAKKNDVHLEGAQAEVLKEMAQEPARRIKRITITFRMPKGIPEARRDALKRIALTCPVHKSFHPDVEIPISFEFPD